MAAIVSLAACGDGGAARAPASARAAALSIDYVPGNPTCQDRGFAYGFKIDPPTSDTFHIDPFNTVTVTINGPFVTWSSTLGMDAVIVKGGPNANVYVYQPNPTDPEGLQGQGLSAPINPNNGQPYGLSHIDFCFDYEVQVAIDGDPQYDRTFPWTLEKVALGPTELTLAVGETYTMPYRVTAKPGTPALSNFGAECVVNVRNPAPVAATVTGVAMNGLPCQLDAAHPGRLLCGAGMTFAPLTLAPGTQVTYEYYADFPGADPTTQIAMTAEIATAGPVGPGASSYLIDFATANVTQIDRCANVSDDRVGALPQVCAGAAPPAEYALQIGPYAICGSSSTFVNTASFETVDQHLTGSASAPIAINVPACEAGCTLTPGYWKTHSAAGPAPYDDTWALIGPAEERTPFKLSGLTYRQALWTPPAGNAYFILAHGFIAAQLNGLDGASLTDVKAVLDSANAALDLYGPADLVAKKSAIRTQFLLWAGALDAFNSGQTGPGHCSE
jgi:hypothetical protein